MIVFIIQGYVSQSEQGQLMDVTTIEVIDTNVKSALKRAKDLMEKPFYRVSHIIEKDKGAK